MNELSIICGDCIQELTKIPGESCDVLIADPPYNLDKDYGNNSDRRAFDQYLDFTKKWLNEAYRVLKPTGTIYVFMGVRYISYLYFIMEQDFGLHFNSWITWHYTQGIGKTRGFSPRHDDILMFTKTNNFTFNLDEVRVPQKNYRERNNMRGANPGNVWEFSHVHYCSTGRQMHPTQKPEGLYERMILASSNENELVIDPFSGSGTALRVASQLNRSCIGIELNPEYVTLTKKRLEQPFTRFDSIDERMHRIPNNLNNKIRDEYLHNHQQWFLKNHPQKLKPPININKQKNIDITLF